MSRVVRTVAATMGVVVLAVTLAGCSYLRTQPTPYDTGIPAARSDAMDQLDDLRARVQFSDRATVLGEVDRDDCDTIRKWWFDDSVDLGYECSAGWTVIVVFPDAESRLDVAAAIDAEMVGIDLPHADGSVVRDLMAMHPANFDTLPLRVDHGEGRVHVRLESEPFQPEFWPQVQTSGRVSGGWIGPEVTVVAIEATGATELFLLSVDIDYWNTDGIAEAEESIEREGTVWVEGTAGDSFFFEVLYHVPADGAVSCIADAAVDPATVVRATAPIPHIRFSLLPGAGAADSQRVRECLEPAFTSGTLLQLSPDPDPDPGPPVAPEEPEIIPMSATSQREQPSLHLGA